MAFPRKPCAWRRAKELTVENERLRAALEWALGDDAGLSSEAILLAACGVRRNARIWTGREHPLDPADLGRCLRLLRKFPWAVGGLEELAKRWNSWRRLVAIWGELESSLLAELGGDLSGSGRAPKTYEMMRAALEED